MLSVVYSGATIGIEGKRIEVEVDVAARGFPQFTIVGLPDKAVGEAKDRVRTAIVNSMYEMPESRITVNMAPADVPKSGSAFDLPVAIGILASVGEVPHESLKDCLIMGELSLDGAVRGVPGVISLAIYAKENDISTLFVPDENAKEASYVDGLTIYPVTSLRELVNHLNGTELIAAYEKDTSEEQLETYEFDFAEVRGQEAAKRALEVAAAGGHNVHLKGPPGTGKTLISRTFPSILPSLTADERLEVAKIYSSVGLLKGAAISAKRPFRSPHHTTSRIGLTGGGSNPTPGEISLAHRGVLFLDEFPEFERFTLEALRQPIEDGMVTISRASGTLTFPCRFQLIAASNPCPCGYLGHPKRECKCLPSTVLKYKKKLSGPILDRIDLHIDVPPVEEDKLTSNKNTVESSKQIYERVLAARIKQHKRFAGTKLVTNAEMRSADTKKYVKLTTDAEMLLKQAILKLSLSARSYFKIIKVGQTIADLAGEDEVNKSHIAEALQYRAKEN